MTETPRIYFIPESLNRSREDIFEVYKDYYLWWSNNGWTGKTSDSEQLKQLPYFLKDFNALEITESKKEFLLCLWGGKFKNFNEVLKSKENYI